MTEWSSQPGRNDKSVAVWGGAGFIGRNVVRALISDGYSARLLTRRPLSADDDLRGQVEERQVSFDAPVETVARALEGAAAAIHCAGHAMAAPLELENFVTSVHNYAAAAKRAAVPRLILISSCSVYGRRTRDTVRASDALHPDTDYARSRARAETEATKILEASPTALCVLRVPAVVGSEMRSNFLRYFFISLRTGFFFHPGRRDAILPCVGVHRLAQSVVRLVGADAAQYPSLMQLADSLKWTELVELYASIAGRKVRRVPLPGAFYRLASMVYGRRSQSRVNVFDDLAAYETYGVPIEWIAKLPDTRADIRSLVHSLWQPIA